MQPSVRNALCAVVVSFMTAGFAFAGEPITIGETIQLPSKVMDEERTILISTPPGYDQTQERYPVLYMTDGAAHLSHTRGTVDFLARNGLMPQLIIVAVANTDRNRDLTPTRAVIERPDGTVVQMPTSGGANTFLKFFDTELFPYVEEHYRTLPYRIFSGHSFGGLFALNAFFTQPKLFPAVLAVSPSLQWDEELPLKQAEKFFKKHDAVTATLFVAMGNEEEGDPRPNRLDRLEKVLEGADANGFEWEVRRLPDETHGSVVLRAHYWGLRKVFEPWNLPRDPETGRFPGGVVELKRHYADLSERYSFTVMPGEQQVNLLGYQKLGNDELEDAIEIFAYNTRLYPASANVYDSYAEALERAGRFDEAMANYTEAVATAERLGDERLELFRANLERFTEEHVRPAGEE